MQAFRHGHEAERARVLAALRDSSDARLTTAARHAIFLLEETEPSLRVLDLMLDPDRPSTVRSWGHIHHAHLAISSGQPATAKSHLEQAAAFDSARALEHEAWLFSLPVVGATKSELSALRERLIRFEPPPTPMVPEQDLTLRADREIHAHVRLYLLGLLNAQLGDAAAALRAAEALPALPGTSPARELARDLAHAVRAEVLRVKGQHAEALAELQRARLQFDANRLSAAPFYAQVRERYVRAELLTNLGKAEAALGWYASFDEHGPWGRPVLASAALQQARIHDALGHGPEAARQYARFLRLWQHAEPRFAPLIEQAKRRLAFLQRAN
jgi:tetratricopeptide (TPR) repeat protein